MRSLIVVSAVALLLSACSVQQKVQPPLRPLAPLPRGEKHNVLQHLQLDFGGERRDLMAAFAMGSGMLRLSLVTPLGVSLMDVQYDGTRITTERYLPGTRSVPAKALVADLQLVYWPLELLQDTLPSGWSLQERRTDGTVQRCLYYDDELHTRVDYSEDNRWQAQVQLVQEHLGYSLLIRNL